jgi:multiple sugar transport system permease protein
LLQAARLCCFFDWIGTQNFEQIFFHDELFFKSVSVTAIYAAVSVPLNMLVAFSVALLLHQKIKGRAIFRTIFYLPSTVPLIASSVIWIWLFNPEFGLLNSILKPFGIPKQQWIYDETTVLPSLIFMSLWGIGPMMIIAKRSEKSCRPVLVRLAWKTLPARDDASDGIGNGRPSL